MALRIGLSFGAHGVTGHASAPGEKQGRWIAVHWSETNM